MHRRPLLAVLLAFAALGPSGLLTSSARADDGKESGSDGDSGDEDGGSDDGGNDEDSGNDGEGDEAEGEDAGDSGGPAGGEDREGDHDDALRAVTAKDAIPLKQMLQQFDRQLDGTVVDVTLIRGTDSLRYRVKFIDPAGRVRRAYFDAVTGALVQ